MTTKVDMYGNKLFIGARVKYNHYTSITPIYGYVRILGDYSAYVSPEKSYSRHPLSWHIVLYKDLIHKELEDMI